VPEGDVVYHVRQGGTVGTGCNPNYLSCFAHTNV
jgi:hypothetical protein